MNELLGDVELNGELVLEGVQVYLNESDPVPGVVATTAGSFELPDNLMLEEEAHLYRNRRGQWKLTLEDGSLGTIVITNYPFSETATTVEFRCPSGFK